MQQFVNSADIETGADELADVGSAAAWLATHVPADDRPGRITERDRQTLVAVREALRALLVANAGADLDGTAIDTLDQAGQEAKLIVHMERDGTARLRAAGRGVDRIVGLILAAMAEAMQAGTWSRLKACPDDECHWAFYDNSRNRSRTWCSMAVCGNRAKARSFRERHRP